MSVMDRSDAYAPRVMTLRSLWSRLVAPPNLGEGLEAVPGSGHVEAFAAWDRLVAHGRLLDRSLLF